MDDDTNIYDGVQVREVRGGRLGTSAYAASRASAADDQLDDIEQRLRRVRETSADVEARLAGLERDARTRRDAATVRERLALGQRLEASVNDMFEARPAAMTAGRARALQWQAEQAGHAARGQADGRRLGDAWERRHGGPRP